MEKIFKKSLALVLSAALCLTALLGCLTVSAEGTAAKPTYALNAVEGKPGDTVTVTANITNAMEVCAHLIDIVFPKDLTIGDVTDSLNRTYLTVEQWEATGNDSEIPAYNVFEDAEGKHIRFVEFVNWPNTTVVSDLTVNIQFKIPAGATAGTVYTLTPTVQAGKYDDDTKLMDVALTPGKITVTTATVCEHDWKFVSAVPATAEVAGTINFKCSKCEETNTESLAYNRPNAILGTGGSAESEIVFRLSAFGNLLKTDDVTKTFVVVEKTNHTSADAFTKQQFVYDYSEATVSGNTITWNVGVSANCMTETVTANVYSKLGDQWYNGMESSKTFSDFALELVKKNGTDAKIKTLVVDAVNYGAAAQVATNHYKSNLANAQFDEYQYNGSTPYGSDTTVIPEATNNSKNNNTGNMLFVGVGLECDSKIILRPQILPHPTNFTGNVNDIVVVASYTDSLNVVRNIAFYNDESALSKLPSSIVIEDVVKLTTAAKGYYVPLSTIASNEMDVTVTFQAYVDGVENSSSTCSVEDAVAKIRTSGTEDQVAVVNALLRYGNSAKTAFSK